MNLLAYSFLYLSSSFPFPPQQNEDTLMDDDATTNLSNTRKRGRTGLSLGEDLNQEDEGEEEDSTTLSGLLPNPPASSSTSASSSSGPVSKRGRIGGAIDAASNRISR